MVKGKFLSGNDDLSNVFAIRQKVFCEEQNIPVALERDSLDQGAIHVLIQSHGLDVATGRLLVRENRYSIGRVAVLKEARGKYYGDFVVRMLLDKAFCLGATEVMISAQSNTVNFYKRIGFEECGQETLICGIPHIPMKIKHSNLCSMCKK